MGGTGVAAARPSGAAFFNPSLLAAEHRGPQDAFALTAPSVNARYADGEDVVEQVDNIQSTIDRLEQAINQNNVSQAQNEAGLLADQLDALDGDTVRGDVGVGALLAAPSRSFAVGVHASAQARGTSRGRIAQSDTNTLRDIENAQTQTEFNNAVSSIDLNNLDSEGRVLGSAVGEVGLSVARAFDLGGGTINLGVTPKVVEMRTFEFVSSVSDFNDEPVERLDPNTDGDRQTHKTAFNLDIGASAQLGGLEHWRLGASVRNVIPRTLKTRANNGSTFFGREKMTLDPLVTVGVAYQSSWFTLTGDLDITENKGMGRMADKQFASLGAEFNVYDWINLRAGARQNLASDKGTQGIKEDTQYTAGFALSPWALRIEAGALYTSEQEFGASLQLGFSF